MSHLHFRVLVILGLFATCFCVSVQQALTQQENPAHKAAETYWNNMSDHLDTAALDQFIAKFPNSPWARVAFSMRYALVADNPNINDYNAFLKKYPTKFQSQMALQEVFNLYKEQNRAVAWFDFLQRYPSTQQGLAAKLHLQTLMAQFAMICDTEETYDDFIEMFPDAPQIPDIIKLAEKKATATEQARFEKTNTDFANDWQRRKSEQDDIATAMAVDLGRWNTEYNRVYKDDKEPIIENGEAFLLAVRIRRYENILQDIYKKRPAALTVREEERHRELIAKLDSIQKTLVDNHKELVKTIRDESAKTRETLREEFAKLGLKLDAGFEMLGKKMDVLHSDLVSVYQELQKVNLNLENIHAAIQDSNKWLEKIDNRLNETLLVLEQGFADTNANLAWMGNKIDHLTNEVVDFKKQAVARLDKVIENQDRSYDLQVQQYETQLDTLAVTQDIRQGQEVMISQNDQLIGLSNKQLGALNNIQNNQITQLNALNGLRGDIGGLRGDVQGLQRDVRNGFERQEKIMQAGFKDVKRSVYDASNRVIQSNQQTIQRIQQQEARTSSSSSGGSSGIRGFFGGVLKVGATAVGTFFGGPVGGAIGAAVGSALDKTVQGGNRKEIFGSAINTGISASVGIASGRLQNTIPDWKPSYYPNTQIQLPPTQQIFDNIVDGGKNALKSEVENQLRKQLPQEAVPLINSMLKGNFEQRKRMAIKAVASVVPNKSGVSEATVRRILAAPNEQELRKTLTLIADENKLKPSVVMYAMDYIL